MDKKILGYWVATGLFCLAMLPGAVMDLIRAPQVMAIMQHLGYPDYVATLLGIWKILGVVALLLPGKGTLKEWAYAGFVFDLSGAVVSHLAVGDAVTEVIVPVVLLGVMATSYVLRPASRR
jgi:hypothetical protein